MTVFDIILRLPNGLDFETEHARQHCSAGQLEHMFDLSVALQQIMVQLDKLGKPEWSFDDLILAINVATGEIKALAPATGGDVYSSLSNMRRRAEEDKEKSRRDHPLWKAYKTVWLDKINDPEGVIQQVIWPTNYLNRLASLPSQRSRVRGN